MYFEFSLQLQISDISLHLSSQGFGGYLGLKMLTATNQMFRCAAVMAPITDFKLYSEFQLHTLANKSSMEEQYFWTFFEVHSLKCIGVLQNTMACDMVIIQSHGIYQSVLVLLFCKLIHLINGIICSVLLFNFRISDVWKWIQPCFSGAAFSERYLGLPAKEEHSYMVDLLHP